MAFYLQNLYFSVVQDDDSEEDTETTKKGRKPKGRTPGPKKKRGPKSKYVSDEEDEEMQAGPSTSFNGGEGNFSGV